MATKQILQQNSINSDKKDLSPHLSCGEMSPHDKFCSTFLHMTWFFSLFTMWRHFPFVMRWNSYTWQSVIYGKISPHDRFFSTSTTCGVCDRYQVWLWVILVWADTRSRSLHARPMWSCCTGETFLKSCFYWPCCRIVLYCHDPLWPPTPKIRTELCSYLIWANSPVLAFM